MRREEAAGGSPDAGAGGARAEGESGGGRDYRFKGRREGEGPGCNNSKILYLV